MKLIIVESPTKARTLTRFLGKDYQIEATMGHIRDLPKSDLGVDVVNNFSPKYIIPQDKRAKVKELAQLAARADEVILATDPDREGEAIGWHIATILSNKTKSHKAVKDYHRIVFHEITENAILDALKKPRALDLKLIDAQQARRVLDRLVGYRLSPLLWAKLSRRWLSAGRVQSVVVRLIVEREREIESFRKEPYWTITGLFLKPLKTENETVTEQFETDLVSRDGVKFEEKVTLTLFDGQYTVTKTAINTENQARSIVASLEAPYTVSGVDRKETRRSPPPPLTTSTMQQDAARKLYFSSKKTMQVAQKLYEEGLITYHRTDSVNLAEKFVHEAREYARDKYGSEYIPEDKRIFRTKSKVAQEAHEAVRPTNIALTHRDLSKYEWVNRDHVRLYELIWKRALSSQMSDAVFASTTVAVTSANGYRFETQGSVVKFAGFLTVLGRDNGLDRIIPPLENGETLVLKEAIPVAHETAPPPRYTEATLVKTLEEKDIGRPSTYAPIITTIIERNYIIKDQKKLTPTDLGIAVTDFLVTYFPEIISLPFTAGLEADLDRIANGESQWIPVIAAFYSVFNSKIEDTYKKAEKVKMEVEETGETCPDCGSMLVFRMGRYGKFIACSNFPACKYTRQHAETIDLPCTKCGKPMVAKKSRHGKMFYGCSGYPACTFAAWKKEDIKAVSSS
jgi:DNA topoisomerase-1